MGRAQRTFRAMKLYMIVYMVDTCHYKLVKAHRMYNTKNEF